MPIFDFFKKLNNNEFKSIPDNMINLQNLQTLLVNDNKLTSIPIDICNLSANMMNFYGNYLCDEYHYDCINHWEPQNCSE